MLRNSIIRSIQNIPTCFIPQNIEIIYYFFESFSFVKICNPFNIFKQKPLWSQYINETNKLFK